MRSVAGRLMTAPTELSPMHWYRPSSASLNDLISTLDDDDGGDGDWWSSVTPLCIQVTVTSPRPAGGPAVPQSGGDDVVQLAAQYSVTAAPRRATDERGSIVKYGADNDDDTPV